MSSEDGAAQDYARIMAEIRSELNGNPEHDGPLLLQYSDRYRKHPLAKEILKEIGRMLYAGLPQDAKAELDEEITGLYKPIAAQFADAARLLTSGDADGARRTLEATIKQLDPTGESFRDDAVTEYRMFNSSYEAALYQKLFQPTREVRRPGYDLVNVYLLYGTILVELRDLEAAEAALRRARRFNPVNPAVLFELAEVLKLQQRWNEFHELSTFALSVAFSAEPAARAYRNLGFYYVEQHNYDVAAACYQKSGLIDKQSITRCTPELMYIAQQRGRPVPASDADAVDKALHANGIQVGVSDAVHAAIAEVDGRDNVERNIVETVRAGLKASNVSTGEPEQLAALLLSCSGQYRHHPKTPEIVRHIGWALADEATPDQRAKLCVAITRLAEGDADGAESHTEQSSAGFPFIRELELRATNRGPEGTVGVIDRNTGTVVAHYDFSDKSMTLNQDLATVDSNFPPKSINDAIELLVTYVGELTYPGEI